MSQRPMAIGLLLCEQLVVEEGTVNVTPVNCFTQRIGGAFPWTSPPFTMVAWLTDGSGDVSLEVIVEHTDTLAQHYRSTIPYRFAAPLQQLRLVVRLKSITFPEPNVYRVLLLANGELIAQRKVQIVPKEAFHE